MTRTRREFLHRGAAALGGACLAGGEVRGAPMPSGESPAKTDADAGKIQCLDYGRSFICGTVPMNNVRFWVESRTTIFDDQARTSTVFYQCASCKSENTFGEKDLFLSDNYDFLPIFGGGHWLIFRRPARISPTYRTTYKSTELWGEPTMILHAAAELTRLDTFESIRGATAAGLPIVTQTEIRNDQTGLRAVIECPVSVLQVGNRVAEDFQHRGTGVVHIVVGPLGRQACQRTLQVARQGGPLQLRQWHRDSQVRED